MKILSAKEISKKISKNLKQIISENKKKPKLAIIQMGDNKESNKYINFKIKKAKELGIDVLYKKYKNNISEEELIQNIKNIEKKTNGLIVQLPLDKKYNKEKVLNSISCSKDIDGLNLKNKKIIPATPRGILTLLKEYKINIKNKKIGVVGQSNLVGKPIANLCEKKKSIVSRFDSKTGLKGTEEMDILIVAVGKTKLIKKENIKKNAIIIDVGINTLKNNKIIGDVDKESIKEKAFAISPVPGGVGPMTVISLFQNLIDVTYKK